MSNTTIAELRESAKKVRKVNADLADQIDAEADKHALPPEPGNGSGVVDANGDIWQRYGPWKRAGGRFAVSWPELVRDHGPLTVIWTPGDPDPRDVVQVPVEKARGLRDAVGKIRVDALDTHLVQRHWDALVNALDAHEAKYGGEQ